MSPVRVCLALVLATSGLGTPSRAEPPAYLRVTPDQVKWSPNRSMPDGVLSAVLYGDPRKGGLYVMHVRFPPRTRLPVHSHPDERVRTVLSGTYYSSAGDSFDATQLVAFPAGTVSHVPVGVWQFAETRDEAVEFQIIGVGPTGIDYRNTNEDPRQGKR
jgi:quercetin dioxygenase-like cupin family protein